MFHRGITRTNGTANVSVVICGNKCDLEEKTAVSKVESEELAQGLNAKFFETSTLANINIENAFKELVKEIKKQQQPAGVSAEVNTEEAGKGKKKGRRSRKCALISKSSDHSISAGLLSEIE